VPYCSYDSLGTFLLTAVRIVAREAVFKGACRKGVRVKGRSFAGDENLWKEKKDANIKDGTAQISKKEPQRRTRAAKTGKLAAAS